MELFEYRTTELEGDISRWRHAVNMVLAMFVKFVLSNIQLNHSAAAVEVREARNWE